ncbi:hypothetical protein [Sphingomonas parva]|uniref:hypothetical protein n=1 Tax=Sphingomonas parva TaxID=2555898 RepID=UPI001CDC0807|nr:hypothetical protein [Sphingomonas parva]
MGDQPAEQPALLVDEIRTAFAQLRSCAAGSRYHVPDLGQIRTVRPSAAER